jgi:hypothetical protein
MKERTSCVKLIIGTRVQTRVDNKTTTRIQTREYVNMK